VVLDESILSRRYGSAGVVLEQLEHVVELAESERVSIQFIPASEPRHPGNSGAFKLITTDYIPEVLVAESICEGQVITNTVEVTNYRMTYTALQGAASSPEQSLARLRAEVTRLRDEQKRLERWTSHRCRLARTGTRAATATVAQTASRRARARREPTCATRRTPSWVT
jgi:hypothetical protein